MKYSIYYSCPNDIQRYVMNAKDEHQLSVYVTMLVNEKAYNITVELFDYKKESKKWLKNTD